MATARRTSSSPVSKGPLSSGIRCAPQAGLRQIKPGHRRGNRMQRVSIRRFHTVIAFFSASIGILLAQQARTTWKDYLGGPDSSHYSALKQIHTRNVDKLEAAWSFATGDDSTYTFSPLVVDNVA